MVSPAVTIRSEDWDQTKRIAAEISRAMTAIGWGFVSASTVNEVGETRAITMQFRDRT